MTEGDPSAAVEVDWRAIRRRLRENDYSCVFVLVKLPGVKGSPDDLLEDVATALEAANAAMDRDGEELVWAQGVIPSLKGPMVDLDWIGTEEQTEEWLDTFAETLAGLGWGGKVTAAPQAYPPEDTRAYESQPRLTCYLGTSITGTEALFAEGPGRWLAEADLTRDLCDFAVRWAALPGATTYLGESLSNVLIENPRPARELQAAAERSAQARLLSLLDRPYRSRSLSFDFHANITFQSGATDLGEPTPAWRDQLPAILEPFRFRPEAMDYGFIRPAPLLGHGGFRMRAQRRAAPLVGDTHYLINRHMWDRYIPDAYGIQLLTRTHLEKANDLSAWSVEEIRADRFLVQSKDLPAWWDNVEPPAELLEQARADFGEMVMTYAAIEADPHGWLPGRGRVAPKNG